jgi:hypothetical protein
LVIHTASWSAAMPVGRPPTAAVAVTVSVSVAMRETIPL